MSSTLKTHQAALLRNILLRRAPDYAHVVDNWAACRNEGSTLVMLCDILTDEFVECGLDSNSEPTKYGLEIEDLIDIVNRANAGRKCDNH